MYRIGEAAREVGVSPSALRLWERQGLVRSIVIVELAVTRETPLRLGQVEPVVAREQIRFERAVETLGLAFDGSEHGLAQRRRGDAALVHGRKTLG